MTEPTRLFDCIEWQMQKGASHPVFGAKENGSWKEYSFREVSEIINALSMGLLKLGFGKGENTPEGKDKIALISKNRPEWLMLDMAVQQIGAALTPVYPTINENELRFILQDARVEIIFVNDSTLVEKVLNIRSSLPLLKYIYSFEKTDTALYWKELLSAADENDIRQIKTISDKIRKEDLATIIYTSGTTGQPKGVMLSHANIFSNVIDSLPYFPPGDNLKSLSFLPLNHIFERMISYLYLFKGNTIYYAESMDTIADNLREVKPNLFATVPRLLEKVYEKIMQKGEELTGIKRKLFFWAHSLAEKFEINKNKGFFYRIQLSIADKLIFSKWREALGNEVICIISGGAACQVRLIRIFTAAGIPILEGYGLTETSPVISVNRYNIDGRMFGSVGPVIQNVVVKIAEDGEILCKGPNVMMGYYKRPDLTAEAIQDGWFKTGDIGMMINDTFLKITDRKKEIFKTSGGKYVAPVVVENKLKESPFIENLMVTGEGEKFVGALIIPSFMNLKEWAKDHEIDYSDNDSIVKDDRVKILLKKEVEKYNQFLNHVEQIKKFELLPRDWTVETGELTPKLSLKRKVILEKYKDAVSRIYS
jgi:long-chain acyl-CoA synthetase